MHVWEDIVEGWRLRPGTAGVPCPRDTPRDGRKKLTMNINLENHGECIHVDRGGVAGHAALLRVDAGSRVAAADAPSPGSGARAELDDGGYQVVTRAKGKKAGSAKLPTRNDVSTAVFQFSQPVEASKKRRAEEQPGDATGGTSVTEQIQSLKNLIVQLIAQNEEREEEVQKQMQEIQALRQEVEGVRKLLQTNGTGKSTYAVALTAGVPKAQATVTGRHPQGSDSSHPQRMRVEDDKCAMTINTSRFKGEKTDFVQVKATLQQGIDACTTLEGVKIRCLRQLPGERLNVVFRTEGEAKKARECHEWLASAMPEASVKSETWYPIKCDMVAKSAVIDVTIDGGRTLRKEVCAEFAVDNQSEDMDFTALKARWLSKVDPLKKTGSLVIWLKNKLAADYLLRAGEAFFGGGACGAFCSRYEPDTADKLCFNCNRYGHLQGVCRKPTRCGKCTGAHQTSDCQSQEPPKCAVCTGSHRSSDWQCRRHPYHKRYLAALAKQSASRQGPRAGQDTEMGNATPSQC